ncbi:MAG: hypothetical protein GX774_16480 [Armatimonadetes bacterium]|nr:hypothetical protein [Armatimonadota bacterium]
MHSDAEPRQFDGVPLFDPRTGSTVIEPPGSGAGWWAGAPSACYDEQRRRYLLYYRLRKPRALGRGGECRIAASEDGLRFETIWSARREEFGSQSIERSCLVQSPEGRWRLFIAYVDPADERWRIDLLEADRPEEFRPAERQKVLTAADIGGEGVKDPVVYRQEGGWLMVVSYAPAKPDAPAAEREQMHATADVYNTGIVKSHTGLALSEDGRSFTWAGDILSPPDTGWDSYCTRVSALLPTPHGWVALYDGSASVAENYEERAGVATGPDLRHLQRQTVDGPALTSPHASGSVRYVEALRRPGEIHYYYEYARPDGSHELRVSRVAA